LLEKLQTLEERYNHLERLISDPDAMKDMATWQKNSRTHSKLTELITKFREYKACRKTIEDTLELLREKLDDEMRELAQSELDDAKADKERLEAELRILLLPRDPFDDKDVIMEIRGGAGGEEAALFAGLEYATGDAVIPMDVDLQDPVEVIPHLLAEWQKGADVVLAKRRDRSSDGYLKRRSASLFYHLLNRISYTHIEENVGDFRLMDRKVVDVIKALPEQQLFMKGVLSWAGFNVAIVEYDRAPRAVGQSKFNAWKLWNLALDGVTSFSTLPLRLWSYIGGGISLLALVYAGYLVVDKVLFGNAVPGYPSLMTAILFWVGCN